MPATQIPAKRTRKAKAPASSPVVAATVAPVAAPIAPALTLTLPTLQPGERYRGIALDGKGTPTHHLVQVAVNPKKLNWKDAIDWAQSIGATLPTRQDGALLVANGRADLPSSWYWTCDEYNASYAWYFISDGFTCDFGKSALGGAVALRRLPINSSIL